jgi:phosphoribosylformylglycinamidine synthase
MRGRPRILILRAAGINCDEETAAACALSGGEPEQIHVNRIVAGDHNLLDYAGLVIPGGFSYGDHLGAGRLLAVDLIHRLAEALVRFTEDGRPVLGICNGFQVLVKAGLLPGHVGAQTGGRARQSVTLAANERGHYECRWVRLALDPTSPCIFTRGMASLFTLPIGHGEGRLVAEPAILESLAARHLVVLRYASETGQVATAYPENPNGSQQAIAGICNQTGAVFGLMPHPDRAYLPQLHPDWIRDRQRSEGDGLAIFRNMIQYAQEL